MKTPDTATETLARAAAVADGIDPNKRIAGQPAWQLYLKRVKRDLQDETPDEIGMDVVAVFAAVAELGKKRAEIDSQIADHINAVKDKLIGKKVAARGAVYKITYVTRGWMNSGMISARGKRITKNGTLSRFDTDLGAIYPANFGR